MMRNHITLIGIATVIVWVTLVGFNWLVDPYKIWNVIEIHRINAEKPQLALNERIYKIIGLSKRHASTVILGTSRSDIGLNPNHEALGTDTLNLGISAQPNLETRLIFDLLADKKNVNTVIIGLDFPTANALAPYPADFDLKNFESLRRWQLLSSISTLGHSVLTIVKSRPPLSEMWSENGLRLWSGDYIKSGGGHRKLMRESEKGYLTHVYWPPPSCSFDFASKNKKLPPLEEIRAVFSRAHREHIALKLLISPSHARQWETLAATGLWDKWEEWKQRLVQMNEEEARRAGQPPFPLWDFSGYNSISTEAVPALGDTKIIMRWYFDSSHYAPSAGNLVLDRIFNFKSSERTVPDDFGVLLTSRSIDAHLANIRASREHYRQTHPDDVAEIDAMAKAVAKTKHCRPTK